MHYKRRFRNSVKIFFRLRVFGFILIGACFMFLTFLTHNNALELGISGIASIFIGIAVNNYTAIETEQKDERRLLLKNRQAIKTLLYMQEKIKKIEKLSPDHTQNISLELLEMNNYIDLCIHYLKEG
jgi:hypothetical protein